MDYSTQKQFIVENKQELVQELKECLKNNLIERNSLTGHKRILYDSLIKNKMSSVIKSYLYLSPEDFLLIDCDDGYKQIVNDMKEELLNALDT